MTALGRREFLKLTGMSAGCLVLGWRPGDARAAGPLRFDLFLSLDASGQVEIVAHRSEMGQGIRTALPLVLADEMDADFDRVRVVQAPGDERYGSQNTDGSHSIRDFFEPMRKVGATARHMLVTAAAQAWGVPAGGVRDGAALRAAIGPRGAAWATGSSRSERRPCPCPKQRR